MRIILEESKIPKKKATSVMGTQEISTLKLYIKLYKLMFPLAGAQINIWRITGNLFRNHLSNFTHVAPKYTMGGFL